MRHFGRGQASRNRRLASEILEPRWAFNVAPLGVTLDPGTVPENSGLLSFVGQLKVSAPDVGDTHRFILLDSAGGRFTLDGDQVVVATGPELDFETAPLLSITVRAIDAGGLSFDATLPILVTDLNEPPTDIELEPAQVFEDSGVGFVVGQLSSADPDAQDSFTYSLVDAADGRFAVQANQIVFAGGAGLDFETQTSHTIRVKATDAGGLSFEKDLVIDVTNVNERPTDLELSNAVTPENSPAGTIVGLLSATDVDYNATGLVLLTSKDGSAWLANLGPAAVSFDAYQLESAQGKLSPAGWRSMADWAASGAAEALAVLGPGDGKMATGWEEAGLLPEFLGEFNVAATAELAPNEVVSLGKPLLAGALDDLQLTYHETGANAGIRTAPVLDQRPLTFELLGSADGRFEVVGNQLRVATNAKLDFETGSKLPIRVRVVDEGNLSVEKSFVVALTNVNETPVVAAPVPTIVATGGSLALPGFKVSDPDILRSAGDQAQYRFALSADRGILTLGSLVGLEVVEGANGSSALAFVGTLNALNAALTTLTYQAPADYAGPVQVILEANDQGYLGAGGPLTGTGSVALTVDHAPVATADQYQVSQNGQLRRESYSQAVLTSGPLAYWRLGDPAGAAQVVDAVGNYTGGGYQGNVQLGQPSAVPSDHDSSATFDGQSGATVPFAGKAQSLQQSFSVEAWIRPTKGDQVQGILTARAEVFGGGWAFGLDGQQLMFTTFDHKNYRLQGSSIPLNEWSHVAVVFDASHDASFFVNGEFRGKVEGEVPPGTSDTTAAIGRNPINVSEFWYGGLDEIALYARELSANEIALHYQASQTNLTVLANDSDADGDALTASLAQGPQNGQVSLAADGSFVYTPNPGFVGADEFFYRVSDGQLSSAPALVTINVLAAAATPGPNADFDGDGDVDLTDFGLLKANFGASLPASPGDADHNGQVDLNDFGVLKASFGRSSALDDDVLLALAIDQATRPLK